MEQAEPQVNGFKQEQIIPQFIDNQYKIQKVCNCGTTDDDYQ